MIMVGRQLVSFLLRPFFNFVCRVSPGTAASALRRQAARKAGANGGSIQHGLFSGVRLKGATWGHSDKGAINLGFYESEAQEWLRDTVPARPRDILVLGAADGLYPLGLLRAGLGSRVVCFERDARSRRKLVRNFEENVIDPAIFDVKGEFRGIDSIHEMEGFRFVDSLFVVDIEGAEFEFLTAAVLKELSKGFGLIEIHASEGPLLQDFKNRVEKFFVVQEIFSGGRNPYQLDWLQDLSDDYRWALMSEGRSIRGHWFGLSPKRETGVA